MIQELVTYLIIAAALLLALLKLKERFLKKKVKEKCAEPDTLSSSGCGGCGADCPVRQAPFRDIKRKKDGSTSALLTN
ncbi:MAG: hypothetical protein ACOZDD_08530 [Bacteroidota bacterium]|mgnify:CR=1 FL=1